MCDFGGGETGDVKRGRDAQGGESETDGGIGFGVFGEDVGVEWIGVDEETAGEIGDLLTEVEELLVAAMDEATELGAAQFVAFDGVVDGSVGEPCHIEERQAQKLSLLLIGHSIS